MHVWCGLWCGKQRYRHDKARYVSEFVSMGQLISMWKAICNRRFPPEVEIFGSISSKHSLQRFHSDAIGFKPAFAHG